MRLREEDHKACNRPWEPRIIGLDAMHSSISTRNSSNRKQENSIRSIPPLRTRPQLVRTGWRASGGSAEALANVRTNSVHRLDDEGPIEACIIRAQLLEGTCFQERRLSFFLS